MNEVYKALQSYLRRDGVQTNESNSSSGDEVLETQDGKTGLMIFVEVYDRATTEHKLIKFEQLADSLKELDRFEQLLLGLKKKLVAEWNEYYGEMDGLKDLSAEAYEAEVGYGLLEVCDGDYDLAISVLNHSDCQGGWMVGDAEAFLQRKKNES